MITYQCTSSTNKFTTLVWDVDSEGGCAHVRAQDIWEISVITSQFCCESKTPLGNKVCLKNTRTTMLF